MLWFKFFAIIIIWQVINSLKLPGPCPKVSSSNLYDFFSSVNYGTLTFSVVYIAPFAVKDSYLFPPISPDYLLAHTNCDEIALIIAIYFDNCIYLRPDGFRPDPLTVKATRIQTNKSDEIQLSSYLVSNDSEVTCQKRLNESVTVWLDREYIVVWSCQDVQVDEEEFHDAALIYGFNDGSLSDPYNNTMFAEIVRNFQYLTTKYLNDTLEDLVKWPKQLPIYQPHKCPMTGLIECPGIMKDTFGYLMGVAFLIVIILIVLGILKDGVM